MTAPSPETNSQPSPSAHSTSVAATVTKTSAEAEGHGHDCHPADSWLTGVFSKNWVLALLGFLVLAITGAVTDLVTKTYVFAKYWPPYLPFNDRPINREPNWWLDGVLGIQTSTNGGALFGMMEGYQFVFITLSLAALFGLLVWLFLFQGWRDRLLVCCLGLITGGIIGNLYDRLGLWHEPNTPAEFHHHVRDWIHFRLAGVYGFDPWPNFNIADSLLVVGVGLMLIQNLFFAPKQEPVCQSTDPLTKT